MEVLTPLISKLESWLTGGVAMLPNIVVALATLVAAHFVSKLARTAAKRGLARVSSYEQINNMLATLTRVVVLCAGIFIALGAVKLDKTVTSLLAGVGIIGLALGFAFQDLATNLISGIYLAFRRPFKLGELVEIAGQFGIVEDIQLRSTTVRQLEGPRVIVPNKDVFHAPIVNLTRAGRRRVDVPVGVSYDDDLVTAREVALDAVRALPCRLEEEPLEAFYEGFGGSSIDLVVRFWIAPRDQCKYLEARSDAIIAVKAAFDEHDISIPFPIRTLDLPRRLQLASTGEDRSESYATVSH